MRHQNSVFHTLTKHVPWHVFDDLVERYGADTRVRRLSTRSQLIAMLYSQLSGATSLREIEAGLESHAARLYHVGAAPICRSTLADANRERPAELFGDLFAAMLAQAGRVLKRRFGEAVRLIDSTGLRLSGLGAQWATYSARVRGAKLHVVYDPDAARPLYAAVTAARVNDITAAKQMPIEPGATYVYDLGYYDYRWWAEMHEAGCRLVTRFKATTPLLVVEECPLAPGTAVLSDRIGFLPLRQASRRSNPMSDPVREIRVTTETGKELRLLTNDLDAPADEIAALYRRRWAIELFFRWVKQTLKIRHFVGRSENAVRIQIAVALIAYLILQAAHQTARIAKGPLAFARLVRANLMHRRPIDSLLATPQPQPRDPRQLTLCFTQP